MKYYGRIGFETTRETAPSVWETSLEFRNYYGEVIRAIKKYDGSQQLNDNVNINNSFSILSDPFASDNLGNMKCIEFMGTLWKITSIEVQYPRLILSIGGVYNANEN